MTRETGSRRLLKTVSFSNTAQSQKQFCENHRGGTGTGSGRVLHYTALPGPGQVLL